MSDIVKQLLLQLVLILLNAFFAATEIAVISLNEKKVQAQAESGVNAKAGTETGADQISDMAQSGRAGSTDQKEDALVYICPSCGAEVVTDATTAATFCYYCHNPVVLSGKLSGDPVCDG